MEFHFSDWIDGYSNCGTKIKTHAIKSALRKFQAKYPERDYDLIQHKGLWYIATWGS
jgi:hypothetical protein